MKSSRTYVSVLYLCLSPGETPQVVIGVSSIHGGDASNIIPEEVKIVGTIRTTSMDMMKKIQGIMRDRVVGIAGANGCSTSVNFHEVRATLSTTRIVSVFLSGSIIPCTFDH